MCCLAMIQTASSGPQNPMVTLLTNNFIRVPNLLSVIAPHFILLWQPHGTDFIDPRTSVHFGRQMPLSIVLYGAFRVQQSIGATAAFDAGVLMPHGRQSGTQREEIWFQIAGFCFCKIKWSLAHPLHKVLRNCKPANDGQP